MSAKTFRTDVILTLATGIAMGKMTFSDVQELVGHLAGGPVWTHQLVTLHHESEAAILAFLGDRFEPFDDAEGFQAYRDRMVAKLGETMDVPPADKPFHRADAVMADAVELMGGDASRVIGVSA